MNQITAITPLRKNFAMTDIRSEFPILSENAQGDALCYLDNAATSLKPRSVIESITDCYTRYGGPVHRGLYPLADEATVHYEMARKTVATFLNAPHPDQVLFTPSATQSINMVAEGWAKSRLGAGDVIYVSRLEHHANYLPWQRICQQTGAELKIIELTQEGELDFEGASGLFDAATKLIALCHISNVTGLRVPIEDICAKAKQHGIAVMIDAAQSVAHEAIDVQALSCDFLAFSAHKMFGPTGIGVLYANAERLAEMEPFLVGGGMVEWVGAHFDETTFMPAPTRFEAGSQNLAGAVGLAAAVEFIHEIRAANQDSHVDQLAKTARKALSGIKGVRLMPCPDALQTSIVSFVVDDVHPHDVAQTAGDMNVALRAGHHCAQPLMQHFDLAATVRASFSIYNRDSDIAALCRAVEQSIEDFGWG